VARFFERLASFSRLILFDRRGAGASDPVPLDALPTWEDWTDDLRVVLDTVGSERAAIFAERDAGVVGMLFAATHPHRVSALVLGNTSAKYREGADYPAGHSPEAAEALVQTIGESWGTERIVSLAMPSLEVDKAFSRWAAKFQRAAVTPRMAATYFRYVLGLDARWVLPLIRVPTLVLHRTDYALLAVQHGRYLAEHIADARLIEIPGRDGYFFAEAADEVLDHIEEFLTGVRRRAASDSVLATVLFTDMVGATERAVALGDRAWRDLLDRHHVLVRQQLARFRGREIDTTGDGFLVAFDGPTRAIHCAAGIRDAVRALGMETRAGLHAGECELIGDKVGGIAVHTAARVMAEAAPGEILVSSTVKDLVAGSGIRFRPRGVHALRGVPGAWALFAVEE
jgi:class 3 adenylate cyclase